MHRARLGLVAGLAAVGLTAPFVAPATAAPGPPKTVVEGPLALPLGLAVSGRSVFVTQAGPSGLLSYYRNGRLVGNIVEAPGQEIAGPELLRGGGIAYLRNTPNPSEPGQPPPAPAFADGKLVVQKYGSKRVLADLVRYETRRNPDRYKRYGFQGLPADCLAQLPPGPFAPYRGIVDSHPYATAQLRDGSFAVADAGGNDIVRVTRRGRVSTIAVLPPQPLRITAELAAAQGLPACVTGYDYNFEAVPTDVEVGPRGVLYVTTLPGGPEDPSFGARGSLYKVYPNGYSRRVATGFAGATNVAVSPRGNAYVTELFGGKVTRVDRWGRTSLTAEVNQPAAVEYDRGALYVTTDAFGAGKVVRIRL